MKQQLLRIVAATTETLALPLLGMGFVVHPACALGALALAVTSIVCTVAGDPSCLTEE